MPERNPQIIAEQNRSNCLRRSPRFVSETRIGSLKRERTPPCSRKEDAKSQISRRKLQTQCVTEKRATRSWTESNKNRRQGEKKSNRNDVEAEGWTEEQEASLRTAYLVPGKSAKECFDRIHSDQSTPSQPLTRARPKKKEPLPILFSPTKFVSPARKKRVSRMRLTLAAQKTIRKLLQKQHNEDQDYEADLFSVLEPTIDPFPPLNLQDDTPFSSPPPNQ